MSWVEIVHEALGSVAAVEFKDGEGNEGGGRGGCAARKVGGVGGGICGHDDVDVDG